VEHRDQFGGGVDLVPGHHLAQVPRVAGLALHAGYVADSPNSHGCVHLPASFAKKLYSITDVGMPIYIGA